MKKLKSSILLLVMSFALAACTTNNGDIGVYYGNWALDQITVDGAVDTSWCADNEWTTWSFQNNIIRISKTSEHLDMSSCWGTWSEDDGKLSLNFTYSDNNSAPGTSAYEAPLWIYIETNTITVLNIDSQSSKSMVLSTTDSAGHKITYTLRKTH